MASKKSYKIDPFEDISKKGEFQVPEGYFNQLTNDVMGKIDNEVGSAGKKNWQRNLFYFVGSAAVLLIGLFIFNSQKMEDCITFACLLEKTEITKDDMDWLEDEVELDFLFDVEDDEIAFF